VDGAEPAWHLYVIRHDRADAVAEALAAAGIGQKAYYRVPAHLQPAMTEWGNGAQLPATAEAARTHLAIPMSPVLERAQVDEVVAAVRAA
jgi:dTDP-4-amino-4,6-dideoxygalactose transaminase